MEIQLQELIDQIKKDGVNEAEAAAEKIIADANKKAEKILHLPCRYDIIYIKPSKAR